MAIPRTFRKLLGIATPVCALVRNDVKICYFVSASRSESICMAISLDATVAPLALA